MNIFRTVKMQKALEKSQKERELKMCPLCHLKKRKKIGSFYLVHNEFWYDKMATKHDMLITVKHQARLTQKQLLELEKVKRGLYNDYRTFHENFPVAKSIYGHWHAHLLIQKT